MDHIRSVEFAPVLKRISILLAQACLAIGILVLVGWALNVPLLKSLRPGLANMRVNTAIGFVLVGVALLAWLGDSPRGRMLCRVLGALLIWRGGVKLLAAASGLDLALDQWIFPDSGPAHGSMAALTALNFVLTGTALLLLGIQWKRQIPSEWLAAAAFLLAIMALLGKVSNAAPSFISETYADVALHTSLAFLLSSLAILLADPGHDVAAILADGGQSGRIGRRLLPPAVILPLCLGWLSLTGEKRGLYSTEYALTLLVLACIVSAVAFTVWVARNEKKASLALNNEEERLRVTLRSIGDGVIAVDMELRVTTLNVAAEKMTGWLQVEALGRPIDEVFRIGGKADGGQMENPVMKALRLDVPFEVKEPFILISRSGREVTVADSSSPIHNAEGAMIGAVLVFRDVSAKQRLDKELLQLQKMGSLSVLAGGIAHDFNNILSVILANVSMAAAEHGTAQMDCLKDAEAAVVRGSQLSGQLMAFAKGNASVRKPVDLGPIVKEAAKFALTGTSSRVVLELGDEPAVSEVDPGQVSQVVQNLVLNASQAMPSGGLVHVAMLSVNVAEHAALPLAAGRYHQIVVSDEGQGIRPEVLEKIFEPFFTTKVKGNGLGLASAFSIAKSHGGYLMVDTLQGRGSAFSFYLPASSKAAPAAQTEFRRTTGGHGGVLVMDDDAAILKVTLHMLTSLGYIAQGAAEGASALEMQTKALAEGQPYDVAILDLTVPGAMGGQETVQQMLKIQPTLRTIVASGYSADPIMEKHDRFGFAAALPKPYSLHAMGETLRSLLKEPEAGA